MHCFSTSIFEGFGLDFGPSGPPKMEPPSWTQKCFFRLLGALGSLLKIDVFKKWRLGRLWARFWRVQGSILVTPRLDFKPKRANIGWQPPPGRLACWLRGGAIPRMPKGPKMLKNAKKAKKANRLQDADAQGATTKAYSTTKAGAKKGGRRWLPPGGYN